MKYYTETAEYIKKATGIDIFKKTRQREYVEYRALYNYILYKIKGLSLMQIVRIYQDNGKPYNHATVLHSLKMFDIYKTYNHKLLPVLDELCYELYGSLDNEIAYIKNSISEMSSGQIIQVSDMIKEMLKPSVDENTKNIKVQAELVEA